MREARLVTHLTFCPVVLCSTPKGVVAVDTGAVDVVSVGNGAAVHEDRANRKRIPLQPTHASLLDMLGAYSRWAPLSRVPAMLTQSAVSSPKLSKVARGHTTPGTTRDGPKPVPLWPRFLRALSLIG